MKPKQTLRELILSPRFDPLVRGKWREIALNRPSEEVKELLSEGFQESIPEEEADQAPASAQRPLQFVDEEC